MSYIMKSIFIFISKVHFVTRIPFLLFFDSLTNLKTDKSNVK